MRTIVFTTLQLSQPRCIKRIAAIADTGIPIKVYGFDSGLYNDNLNKLPFPVEKIIKRDKRVSKFKKIYFFANVIYRILSENKGGLFYFFGFELCSIAWLLGCREYIYEEADVSASRIKSRLLKRIMLDYDRMLYRKAKLVVNTSEGFMKYLFPTDMVPKNIELQLNKLHPVFTDDTRRKIYVEPLNEQHIKFGFVGLIRYPDTIIRFAKVIGKEFPMHEFHFYGEPEVPDYIDDELKSYKNVFLHGRFKNPQDLQAIYESIDVSIVCYDVQSDNVRIAEPNKLYESIYFKTPLVVSKNTFLAEKVEKLGVGYAINCADDKEIAVFINSISSVDFSKKQEYMNLIPTNELIDNPSKMITKIKDIIH